MKRRGFAFAESAMADNQVFKRGRAARVRRIDFRHSEPPESEIEFYVHGAAGPRPRGQANATATAR